MLEPETAAEMMQPRDIVATVKVPYRRKIVDDRQVVVAVHFQGTSCHKAPSAAERTVDRKKVVRKTVLTAADLDKAAGKNSVRLGGSRNAADKTAALA